MRRSLRVGKREEISQSGERGREARDHHTGEGEWAHIWGGRRRKMPGYSSTEGYTTLTAKRTQAVLEA